MERPGESLAAAGRVRNPSFQGVLSGGLVGGVSGGVSGPIPESEVSGGLGSRPRRRCSSERLDGGEDDDGDLRRRRPYGDLRPTASDHFPLFFFFFFLFLFLFWVCFLPAFGVLGSFFSFVFPLFRPATDSSSTWCRLGT